MDDRISVIIPIYNTYRELPKCLESVCSQTYKNLEIICVDDGSTDGSEKILDEFAAKDSRIVAIHQQNAGESNARNAGLNHATGDYITFVDCDDWIDVEMYTDMLAVMRDGNLDIVAVSWYKELENQTVEIKNQLPVSDQIFGRNQMLTYIYRRDEYRGFAYMWNKLYKRELLLDENGEIILFDEDLKLGGDVLYLGRVLLNVKRARYLDRAYYHYRQREHSGCHTKNFQKLKDWVRAYEMVIELFKSRLVPVEITDYVRRFMAYHAYNAVKLAIEQGNPGWAKYFGKIMSDNEEVYVRLNQENPERIDSYRNVLREKNYV